MSESAESAGWNSFAKEKISVPATSLLSGGSPRIAGEDPSHVRQLAETEADLPPILVHRQTMRVIDGMHRLEAARARGNELVSVEYFDGTDFEAFVMAVRLNVAHGLPLTRADRKAAAARILRSDSTWSDRAISEVTGLSAPTIGGIRARSVVGGQLELTKRRGRDGRMRPLSTADGRRKAAQLISSRPELSLRKIAKEAGISTGTARDVRTRVQQGEDPVSTKPADKIRAGKPRMRTKAVADYEIDAQYLSYIRRLENDPSVRSTDMGKFLIRCLKLHAAGKAHHAKLVAAMPEHSISRVVHMARCCSSWWAEVANDLEIRQRDMSHEMHCRQ